ncbi:heme peroxidase [Camillea tinctor]|nr:heme peroxidase [Camillea tinctor]
MSSDDPKFHSNTAPESLAVEFSKFFADPFKVAKALLKDCAGLSKEATIEELVGLLDELVHKDQGIDDKKGNTELLMGILCSLPPDSKARELLNERFLNILWDSLQHPPLSFVNSDIKYEVMDPSESSDQQDVAPNLQDAIEYKAPDSDIMLRVHLPGPPDGPYHYRTPDGSYNNPLQPNLGRAGSPYAKAVINTKSLAGVRPDPGLLFDILMARDDDHFRENPAGLSSIFFYHASLIIHDLFRTSNTNPNTAEVSSYLDMAFLYGSSLKDQLKVRTMKEGKLKPDAFHEKRLLGQPPGVNVLLVLYNRFHNFAADMLLKINENERFTLTCGPDASAEEKARAVAKQDHNLFNTARLITNGLFANISLHDYIRGIINTHHSSTEWTIDPRTQIRKQFDGEGAPRGVGNQVTAEFNLLYRWHSCISKKDERWTNEFFLKLFPGRNLEDLEHVSVQELGNAWRTFQESIDEDPGVRTFDGLKRQEDGTFKDEDLVRILKEGMEDPAGTFGARTIPKILKFIEVAGIIQARKWGVASLNEFRAFFGLKKREKFSDFNSEPEIANILEKLYTHPDMIELYPGLLIEDIKPQRNTGDGLMATYSMGRAILSDAITVVRADRFLTIDYNVSNLTNWGYAEVAGDTKTLGGSMAYKLIQRGVPGWFPYNSITVMQPYFTKKANIEIAKELGTIDQFTLDDPKPPRKNVTLFKSDSIRQVLGNPEGFISPWAIPMNDIFPGKMNINWFMLAGDEPYNKADRENMVNAMSKFDLPGLIWEFVERVGSALIQKETFKLKEGLHQIDLMRDVAIPLNAQLLADLFYMDMKTDENPNGALSRDEFYHHLLNVRIWGTNNNDPGQAWNRRRRAQEGARIIIDTTRKIVDEVNHDRGSAIHRAIGRKTHLKHGSLRSCGYKLAEEFLNQQSHMPLARGSAVNKVTDMLWITAFGGSGLVASIFYEIMSFFLKPENASIWAEVQVLAQKNDNDAIRAYVIEAQRLTSTQRTMRIAKKQTELEGQMIQPGNFVIMMIGAAGRNPSEVTDADKFDPQRKSDAVSPFGYGQHTCPMQNLIPIFMAGFVKLVASLQNVRPAPGLMGQVKTVPWGPETMYLDETWSSLNFTPNSWKLHFDSYGLGR